MKRIKQSEFSTNKHASLVGEKQQKIDYIGNMRNAHLEHSFFDGKRGVDIEELCEKQIYNIIGLVKNYK